MKPEKRSIEAETRTLAKGKMYEYGVPEDAHPSLLGGGKLEDQFPLAIGILGDFASETVQGALNPEAEVSILTEHVVFAARVFQSFDEARLSADLSFRLRILAAAAYYLADMPGNSNVLASPLAAEIPAGATRMSLIVRSILTRNWDSLESQDPESLEGRLVSNLSGFLRSGKGAENVITSVCKLRDWAYENASAHDLLMADIICALSVVCIKSSAWVLIPKYSKLPLKSWEPYLSRRDSIKELWPSQRAIGEAGLYAGDSGVIQMPTGAGKSRAIELIIRSAFLSSRTKLAVIVAPFRALCYEISNDLAHAFKVDKYSVNQISDAMQMDLEITGNRIERDCQVLVLTPEKLFYLLRQDPTFIQFTGVIIYDEAHQFDTDSRGVTYELLLTTVKRILSDSAQTVLISAVIENAKSVSDWLFNRESNVAVDNVRPTRRLVGYVSWPEDANSAEIKFNVGANEEKAFRVPQFLTVERLELRDRERAPREFPTKESGSVALYLGLRLVQHGGVAIFLGRKMSASKLLRDAVHDVYHRGSSLSFPNECCDEDELRAIVHIFERNYGENADATEAARLGIFAHHADVPHGIRLVIEHAMRRGLIGFLLCTSTLAQGVNLPIRYLLITSLYQAESLLGARDVQNLMGRAGRSGMYVEGTVIITDHRVYDNRSRSANGQYNWRAYANRIEPTKPVEPSCSDSGTSSLLELVAPLRDESGKHTIAESFSIRFIMSLIDARDEVYSTYDEKWVKAENARLKRSKYTVESIRKQLDGKLRIVEWIESYLMSYRDELSLDELPNTAERLVRDTLAYYIATDAEKSLLIAYFEAVDQRLDKLVRDTSTQARFSRTLIGLDQALDLEEWVIQNLDTISSSSSAEELLEALWPILSPSLKNKKALSAAPSDAIYKCASGWLAGDTFSGLLLMLKGAGATYKHGVQRRMFIIDDVIKMCEQGFGFDFMLVLATVRNSFIAQVPDEEGELFKVKIDLLQKRLKYGLKDEAGIIFYDAGFSERVLAQELAERFANEALAHKADVKDLIGRRSEKFMSVLKGFPSYFTEVFNMLAAGED